MRRKNGLLGEPSPSDRKTTGLRDRRTEIDRHERPAHHRRITESCGRLRAGGKSNRPSGGQTKAAKTNGPSGGRTKAATWRVAATVLGLLAAGGCGSSTGGSAPGAGASPAAAGATAEHAAVPRPPAQKRDV